jgi:hypothetical protein
LNPSSVDIRHLKEFTASTVPRHWILRDVILSERDTLGVGEFCAKSELWLKLLCIGEGVR